METSLENGHEVLHGMKDPLQDPSAIESGSEGGAARRSAAAAWSVAEVCAWLRSRSLEGCQGDSLLRAASSHAISGKALLRLTDGTLQRLGVAPGSLRRALLREVLCLRIQQEMEDLLDITEEWHTDI